MTTLYVAMNEKGQYAILTEVHTHTGYKERVTWTDQLNHATVAVKYLLTKGLAGHTYTLLEAKRSVVLLESKGKDNE